MRKSHSKERTAVVERTQALISDDPGQSLRKLASIVDVSELMLRRNNALNCQGGSSIQIVHIKDMTDAF